MRREDYYEVTAQLQLALECFERDEPKKAIPFIEMALKKLENMYTRKAGYGT